MPRRMIESSSDDDGSPMSSPTVDRRKRPPPKVRQPSRRDTQPSTSQANGSNDGSEDDTERYTLKDIVNYILVANQADLPIKREDIVKNACRGVRLTGVLMNQVKAALATQHKIKLVEVPEGSRFILLHVNSENRLEQKMSEEEKVTHGILLCILGSIFMSGGSIDLEQLEKGLAVVGIDLDSKQEIQGLKHSAKELAALFVKQLYLKKSEHMLGEQMHVKLSWGFRAEKELKRLDVLKYMSEILKTNSKEWTQQYKDALRLDKEHSNDVEMDD